MFRIISIFEWSVSETQHIRTNDKKQRIDECCDIIRRHSACLWRSQLSEQFYIHLLNGVVSRDDRIYSDSIRIRILNIRIRIRQFLSPNIIRIFESFSSNLEYFKHRFPLNLNLNWEFLGALATCWSHLWAPIDKICAWMLLSHYTFMSFLDILSQFLLSAFYFPHYVQI